MRSAHSFRVAKDRLGTNCALRGQSVHLSRLGPGFARGRLKITPLFGAILNRQPEIMASRDSFLQLCPQFRDFCGSAVRSARSAYWSVRSRDRLVAFASLGEMRRLNVWHRIISAGLPSWAPHSFRHLGQSCILENRLSWTKKTTQPQNRRQQCRQHTRSQL